MAYAGKKRWKGLVVGVLGLVILSMLVPLLFLLGIHNGFQGYGSEQPNSPTHTTPIIIKENEEQEEDHVKHVENFVKHFTPPIFKDILKNITHKAENTTKNQVPLQKKPEVTEIQAPPRDVPLSLSIKNNSKVEKVEMIDYAKGGIDESGKICQVKFGSYCLWRQEHKEDMKDSMVKKLKDSLFVARAYFPTIAKLPSQRKFSSEMKQNIQELEKVLSESTTDADLPSQIGKKLERMQAVIAKAKTFPVECHNVDKKLGQIFDMTADEANFHMKQSVFLYQLAVQTMPKSLHCLSMRLTVEFFRDPVYNTESLASKYNDPALRHYVIFSTNVLASSVVINSTVVHAKESGKLVFHVLTNQENYFALKLWFFRNTYKEAIVQVLNLEDLDNRKLYLSLPVEFRVSLGIGTEARTEYLSIFSHSHYLLPEIFQNLEKVVVLDEDVVVQQDLSALWTINMGGKVNAAVQFCSVKLSNLLKSSVGENSFDKTSCAWMSGLNVIDLVKWRELDLTETYRKFVNEASTQEVQNEAAALQASLLTFKDLIYPLDGVWALSGLGNDYNIDIAAVTKAAVLHYNGKMKPWLDLGIPKYKVFWKRYLNREDQFLTDCNVNS
ncbi:probable galacturonosyltransferase 7 [Argentina anserina]|uniref:probable galacturonosyltransferase 7 n=1 Tax=Argentina anserina TaxID=57926 RepID=UPI0021764674|nr:probable galacturonosyltransferase 7 [Potentilla anserina]